MKPVSARPTRAFNIGSRMISSDNSGAKNYKDNRS